MSTNVTWNGTTYSIPASGETGWAALSNFLIALGNNAAIAEEMKQAIRVATTSPVTVSDTTDCVVAVNRSVAGATTVNLPAGTDGRWFVVVDQKGDAATNNITVTPNGAETVNGAATYVISQNNGAIVMAYSVTNTRWNVIARYTAGSPLTNPMTTTGDIIYSADNSGTPARLAAVAAGQLLVSAGTGTAPAWGSTVAAVTSFTLGVKVKSAGAGSTTLSWYEEGTFTPAATFATQGTGAAVTAVGRFTRIGNRVYYNGYITITKGTASGALTITGLPYTSNTTSNAYSACTVQTDGGVTVPANSGTVQAFVSPNSTAINLKFPTSNGGTGALLTAADCSASAAANAFIFNGHYEV